MIPTSDNPKEHNINRDMDKAFGRHSDASVSSISVQTNLRNAKLISLWL